MKKSMHHIGSVLTLGTILLCSNAAFAQSDTTGTGGGSDSTASTTTTRTEDQEDRQDYSWLGLLGLAGLAGLLKKPERHVVHQTNATPPHTPNR